MAATLIAVSLAPLLWPSVAGAAPVAPARKAAPSARPLVVLLDLHAARSAPDGGSAVIQMVAARRPITGQQTVLPVIGRAPGRDGEGWLLVLLPGRPNGHTGWIRERATRGASTTWSISVDISARRVTVSDGGIVVRRFQAVVGNPATPTPIGAFFVEESVQLAAGEVGAPFALALSARSTVLRRFAGGPGQIALHGLANVGGVPGSAVSHGCLRLEATQMRWLAARIGPGVAVTIRA